ncbi:MAG: 50S ribosomal protein L25/general stress protein Ctc [Caldilineae bacterium]|nr:MAG: 50S ribosomal protein L25/general stress protein Ctc [Caldilineae bacterium]
MELVLNVEPRTQTGHQAHQVRAAGLVPGVVYGQGQEAQPLQFKEIDLVRLLRAGGASQLIQLKGLGKKPMHVLLREVQRHPTRRTIMHVDFYRVQMDVAVRTEVPIHLVGESPAVKGGAVLLHNLDRIEVECLPRAIPEAFEVDLSVLESIDDVIHVSDLPTIDGVTILNDPEETIVSLTIPRKLAEELEEEAEEAAAAEAEEAAEESGESA